MRRYFVCDKAAVRYRQSCVLEPVDHKYNILHMVLLSRAAFNTYIQPQWARLEKPGGPKERQVAGNGPNPHRSGAQAGNQTHKILQFGHQTLGSRVVFIDVLPCSTARGARCYDTPGAFNGTFQSRNCTDLGNQSFPITVRSKALLFSRSGFAVGSAVTDVIRSERHVIRCVIGCRDQRVALAPVEEVMTNQVG